jgi:hypothetical protein
MENQARGEQHATERTCCLPIIFFLLLLAVFGDREAPVPATNLSCAAEQNSFLCGHYLSHHVDGRSRWIRVPEVGPMEEV